MQVTDRCVSLATALLAGAAEKSEALLFAGDQGASVQETCRNPSDEARPSNEKGPALQGFSRVAGAGLEPATSSIFPPRASLAQERPGVTLADIEVRSNGAVLTLPVDPYRYDVGRRSILHSSWNERAGHRREGGRDARCARQPKGSND